MTVKKIYDLAGSSTNDDEQFTALLFATCTRIDLDGSSPISSRRCVKCRCSIKPSSIFCEKPGCQTLHYYNDANAYVQIFDIGLDFTDYTGTIVNCRMVDQHAERILGLKLIDFSNMTMNQRTKLKYKFLLERCAVKLLIKKKTICRSSIFIMVLDVKLEPLGEFVKKIKIY